MMRLIVTLMLLVVMRSSASQDMKPPGTDDVRTVIFHFERAGVQPGRYTIQLQADGLGAYWIGPPDFDLSEAVEAQKLKFSAETIGKVMAAEDAVKKGNCETHLKKIAQTGKKVITFRRLGSSDHCEFNFSDSDLLNAAASSFEAIAETMQFGERLAHEHRYDRLSLDAEMQSLTAEVAAGRAIEVGNIAGTLQGLVDDDRVIDRVRRAAARLLEQADVKK